MVNRCRMFLTISYLYTVEASGTAAKPTYGCCDLPPKYMIILENVSCEIEDFVETNLCKLYIYVLRRCASYSSHVSTYL